MKWALFIILPDILTLILKGKKMEVQTYTKKEMISLLKKYKKQISFRRLEDLAGIRHGCIGNFVYRNGKMPQERFRKIRRAWFGELQAKEMEKTHKAMCEPIKQPSCMVVCGVPEKEERLSVIKDIKIVDLSPWYVKIFEKIKKMF